jgi:predicted nuclease with TOPRIM domain
MYETPKYYAEQIAKREALIVNHEQKIKRLQASIEVNKEQIKNLETELSLCLRTAYQTPKEFVDAHNAYWQDLSEENEDETVKRFVCSKCGNYETVISNFCRNCGADMRGCRK